MGIIAGFISSTVGMSEVSLSATQEADHSRLGFIGISVSVLAFRV